MAKEYAVELNVETEKAEANLNDVVGILSEMKDAIVENKKATEKQAEATKDLESGFKKVGRAVKRFSSILTGGAIGLGITLFEQFKEVLGQNQRVTDLFNTAFESLSIAFNDFFKFIENNIGTITEFFKDIFENPKENLKEFADAIKNNLIERFNSLLDTIGFLATAVKKVFERDFVGALDAVKSAAKESVDVVTGVNNSAEKIAETLPKVASAISDYAIATTKAAQASVQLNKQAEIAQVINQGLIEEYDRQAEQQRQIRDDTRNSLDERIAANNKLGEVLEEQQRLMLENADLVVAAAQSDLQKNNNQENYIKLLEAENERKAVLAQIEGFRSEQLVNEDALEREVAEAKKEADEAELERIKKIQEAEDEASKQAKENAKEQIELQRKAIDSTVSFAGGAVQALIDLNASKTVFDDKAAEKQFEQQKKLQLLQTTINTAGGIVSAFTPYVPVLSEIRAGVVTATGIAQSRVIKNQKYQSSGGISTPSLNVGSGRFTGGTGDTQTDSPTISAIPNFANQAAIDQQLNQGGIRAYVVENDISSTQALNKRLREKATL